MCENFDKEITANPEKIADDFILALAVCEDENLSVESYSKTIQLCNYIKVLNTKKTYDDFDADYYRDNPVLKKLPDFNNDLNEVINILGKGHKGNVLTDEEKNKLETFLVIATLPFWHKRTSDFRKRKSSRSFMPK